MLENKAVIWDMDGVIAHTAPYHLAAWQEVFRKRGVDFTREDFQQYFGQRNDTIVKGTLGDGIPQEETDAIVDEKEKSFRRRVKNNIKSLPGAIELMETLKRSGSKIAIGSSAPLENIRLITKALGIDGYFQCIVAGRDVTEGKPSPQIFLLAAEKLGVRPESCIVIEDSVAGVTAAKGAGMSCLAVTNTHPATSLTEADLIVDTLTTVSVEDLDKLLEQM